LYFWAIIAGSTAPEDGEGEALTAPGLAAGLPPVAGGAEPVTFAASDPLEPTPPHAAAPAPSAPNAAAPPRKRRRDHAVMCNSRRPNREAKPENMLKDACAASMVPFGVPVYRE